MAGARRVTAQAPFRRTGDVVSRHVRKTPKLAVRPLRPNRPLAHRRQYGIAFKVPAPPVILPHAPPCTDTLPAQDALRQSRRRAEACAHPPALACMPHTYTPFVVRSTGTGPGARASATATATATSTPAATATPTPTSTPTGRNTRRCGRACGVCLVLQAGSAHVHPVARARRWRRRQKTNAVAITRARHAVNVRCCRCRRRRRHRASARAAPWPAAPVSV